MKEDLRMPEVPDCDDGYWDHLKQWANWEPCPYDLFADDEHVQDGGINHTRP